jgi:malate dehydrogenase
MVIDEHSLIRQYGLLPTVVFGIPVSCFAGTYHGVEGLVHDEFARKCIEASIRKLVEEISAVGEMLATAS